MIIATRYVTEEQLKLIAKSWKKDIPKLPTGDRQVEIVFDPGEGIQAILVIVTLFDKKSTYRKKLYRLSFHKKGEI